MEDQNLTARERALFRDIAAALGRYPELMDSFGVSRLHQHFWIAADEVLLETNDPETRELRVRPVRAKDLPENTLVSQWRVTVDGQGVSAVPIVKCCVDEPEKDEK